MKLLYKRFYKDLVLTHYRPSYFDIEGGQVSINSENQKDMGYEKRDELYYLKKELEDKLESIEALEREAYERGYATGENAGFEMGLKKAEVIIDKFYTLVEELSMLKERYIKENDKKILTLAIAVARKILEKEVKEDEGVFINILNNALKKIERREKITITINPVMQSIIERFKGDIKDICPKIIVNIDPNVSKNFVKVESETEEIIIDFEQELYEISKKLSEFI